MTERWEEIRRQMIDETNSIECDPKGMRSWSDLFNDACKRIAELERILREIGILADQIDAEGDDDFAGLPARVASLVEEAWNRGGDRG